MAFEATRKDPQVFAGSHDLPNAMIEGVVDLGRKDLLVSGTVGIGEMVVIAGYIISIGDESGTLHGESSTGRAFFPTHSGHSGTSCFLSHGAKRNKL